MKFPGFVSVPWLVAGLLLLAGSRLAAQFSGNPGFDAGKLKALNEIVADAVVRKEIPGAVVWLEQEGRRWGNKSGFRAVDPETRPMVVDTIFDAASLTKVMATAPCILLLAEEGKLELDTPASRYLPEFTGGGKDTITLRQMLTHTSGLKPGIPGGWKGYTEGIARAAAEPVGAAPGVEFRYSDINFILLGEIVRRVSGQPLDQFARERIYRPLAMQDTGYVPPPIRKDRIAPTTRTGETVLQGVVHDPTARAMGGVAGHAGLFTNARDIARFCRMILDHGKTRDGRIILKEETVRLMTMEQPGLPGGVKRTLGFDMLSGYSDPKGAHFGPRSFGHTGFTGGCFWVDPDADCFFVLLTNRVHPTEAGSVSNIRWRVATLAAEAMGVARQVKSGADRVAAAGLPELEGKKIGLITNHTGLTSDGQTTLAALRKIPGTEVVRLFSPEHGIAGKLDEDGIANGIDEASGLPVFSLYGATRKPSPESLAGLEALVFDIQDVGARFYTYISTMLNCMEAAADAKLPFVVLDRVNPLGGLAVEGPMPVNVTNPFIACHAIPLRHGLTIGELARLFVKERVPSLNLTVVPLEHWERRFFFNQTLAPWTDPSPNMRSPHAALLYPGLGMLEFSNLSVGRGTSMPFTYLGAPWLDGPALARRLQQSKIPGVVVEPAEFKPASSKFARETCHGIHLVVVDPRRVQAARLGVSIALALVAEHGDKFELDKVNTLLLHPATIQAIRDQKPLDTITASWEADEAAFRRRCADILLYPAP